MTQSKEMQADAIREATSRWRAAATEGDADQYLGFLMEDAVLMAPGMEPMVGRPVISEFIKGVFDSVSVVEVLENAEPVVSGDLGYVWGTYSGTYTSKADGSETPDWGNHFFLWHRQAAGDWKLGFVTWNTKPEPDGE